MTSARCPIVVQTVGDNMPDTNRILRDVADERSRQKRLWGREFDDRNTPSDWVAYIAQYAGRHISAPFDPDLFRRDMLSTAALAVAAIEALDRNEGMPTRHFDMPAETARVKERLAALDTEPPPPPPPADDGQTSILQATPLDGWHVEKPDATRAPGMAVTDVDSAALVREAREDMCGRSVTDV